jgi:putative membrane protein
MNPTLSAIFSALHVLALGIGLGAVFARGRGFKARNLQAVFYADNWWGIAGLLWISTGLMRAFGGLEKGTAYYLHHPFFHAKLGLYLIATCLEMWPMITLIRWRIQERKGEFINTDPMGTFYWINFVEVVIVATIPFFAALMARGVGL